MDKFFANLGGGDKKKSTNKSNGKKDGGWSGGSGSLDDIKKKNASSGTGASRIGGGGGGYKKTVAKKPPGAGGGSGKNIFENAGAGINDALGKIDLFKQNNTAKNSRGGGQSLGGSKPGVVLSVSLDQPGSLGMEVSWHNYILYIQYVCIIFNTIVCYRNLQCVAK